MSAGRCRHGRFGRSVRRRRSGARHPRAPRGPCGAAARARRLRSSPASAQPLARRSKGTRAASPTGGSRPRAASWNSDLAVRMATTETVVTFDIGAERTVRSLLVQADANDSYLVEGSWTASATSAWARFRASTSSRPALRALRVAASPLRFLRLSTSSGDGRAVHFRGSGLLRRAGPLGGPSGGRSRRRQLGRRKAAAAAGTTVSSRWWELTLALLGLGSAV